MMLWDDDDGDVKARNDATVEGSKVPGCRSLGFFHLPLLRVAFMSVILHQGSYT